jgi:bacilliredoxin
MRYPEHITAPMREEMVQMGFQELHTPDEVKNEVEKYPGTVLLFVNSVCGCAGGIARPGLALSLFHANVPDKLTTSFAGVDLEAVAYARGLFSDYPPSSPQAALFKGGRVVRVTQRHEIEGTSPEHFCDVRKEAFDAHCQTAAAD